MEMCNYHIIGPVFSHAAGICNYTVFLNYEIPGMESLLGKSVLVCLFEICASKKHASRNTLQTIFEKENGCFLFSSRK